MSIYSPEIKEQIVKKVMPPNNESVAHRETGFSTHTLFFWKKQFQNRGFVVPAKPSNPERWDARAKLAAVSPLAIHKPEYWHGPSLFCAPARANTIWKLLLSTLTFPAF